MSDDVHRAGSERAAWIEITAMTALLLLAIWVFVPRSRSALPLVFLVYVGIGLEAHLRRGERPRDLGMRLDNLGPAARAALLWVGTPGALVLSASAPFGAWHFPPVSEWLVDLPLGVLWGTVQQYGLLCVLYLRLREVLPGRAAPIAAGGLLFGLFHLPNPFLVPVTLAAGALSCWLFERERNLWVLGIAHGLLSFVLFYAFPEPVTFSMKVGMNFLDR